MEWFIRDAECRESICVAISRAETASDILTPPKDTKGLVSERLHDIIRRTEKSTPPHSGAALSDL